MMAYHGGFECVGFKCFVVPLVLVAFFDTSSDHAFQTM